MAERDFIGLSKQPAGKIIPRLRRADTVISPGRPNRSNRVGPSRDLFRYCLAAIKFSKVISYSR